MSFSIMNDDMEIVGKLGDEPNEDDGLDAAGLKAVFDQAGKLCKAAINKLISELHNAAAAASVGFSRSASVPADNVQDAIENVQQQIAGVSQGAVPNNSITTEKLVDESVTGAKVAAGTLRQDIDGTDAMHVRRSEFTSLTNGLKLHYFKALGMVFLEGVVTVVPSSDWQSATLDFDRYAPVPMAHNTNYYLYTDDRQYRMAEINSFGGESASLIVTAKNISSVGESMKIHISGWYFCNGEGS